MDKSNVLTALAALGHETRLDVFRLLVIAGNEGMLAGEISDRLNVRQNTLSSNLSILQQAGLLKNERQGRAIRYFADMQGMSGMLAYLMEDCCGGNPKTCQPVIDEIACCGGC